MVQQLCIIVHHRSLQLPKMTDCATRLVADDGDAGASHVAGTVKVKPAFPLS
jgi:hypothetical protein